jgi:hypothetical protein
MSVRSCFTGKIEAGKVDPDAGQRLLAMLDSVTSERGRRQALLDIAAGATADAERQADLFRRTTIAQANVLRAVSAYEDKVKGLRETKGSFGFGNQAPPTLGKEQSSAGFALRSLLARDPFEIANWGNVSAIARDLRGQAHAIFADAIEALRPKALGLKSEAALELDLLRAGFGETTKDPRAGSAADAWFKAEGMLADEYIAAGGQLAKRERYMPNPDFDRAKVQALGPDRFRALVDANVDREKMIDFSTNAPMTDTRYNELVRRAYDNIVSNSLEGTVPSGAVRGRPMVANAREAPRLFAWKNAESWMKVAEAVGEHSSPYEAMLGHISAMANDTALMRTLGPNPRATLNFMLDVLAREPARLGRVAGDDSAKADRRDHEGEQGDRDPRRHRKAPDGRLVLRSRRRQSHPGQHHAGQYARRCAACVELGATRLGADFLAHGSRLRCHDRAFQRDPGNGHAVARRQDDGREGLGDLRGATGPGRRHAGACRRAVGPRDGRSDPLGHGREAFVGDDPRFGPAALDRDRCARPSRSKRWRMRRARAIRRSASSRRRSVARWSATASTAPDGTRSAARRRMSRGRMRC